MPSVDFAAWVEPNLDVTLGGRDYSIPPPSVDKAKIIVALTVVSEHNLGLVKGDPDPEVVAIVDAQTDPLAVVTLGRDIYDRMVADGVTQITIDRVGYYAMHYFARGKAQADWLAAAMWSPDVKDVTDTAPKAQKRSKSGPSTGLASRTRTASSRTTGSRPA
jgi:hypothetical protein